MSFENASAVVAGGSGGQARVELVDVRDPAQIERMANAADARIGSRSAV